MNAEYLGTFLLTEVPYSVETETVYR